MRGRLPKDAALRQRRNRRKSQATLTQDAEPRKRAPRLPDRGDEQPWHRLTRAWWRDLWHSPMAGEYLRADRHALFRLAVLIDTFWREPSKDLAAEIRLEQQAFGLTPLDRRRLEWSVEKLDTVREIRKRTVQEKARGAEDPRAALGAT